MSLSVSSTQLREAYQALQVRWDETTPLWRDTVRADFEEQYWVPLEPCVVGALEAIERMMQIMSRMRQECE
jgi:hypothetical protein